MVVGIIPSTGLIIVGLCLRNMLSLLEIQLMLSPFFLLCGGFSCSALIVGLFVYIFIPFAGGGGRALGHIGHRSNRCVHPSAAMKRHDVGGEIQSAPCKQTPKMHFEKESTADR